MAPQTNAAREPPAWDTHGNKLWSTFVEPPWSYEIDGEQLTLDVMGEIRSFAAKSGPAF